MTQRLRTRIGENWVKNPNRVLADIELEFDERTRGSSGRDNRLFVEAVLWLVRTGVPWRDLPEGFGPWNSVFRRFSRWSRKGVWWRIFAAMSDDPDFEYLIVDSTIVRAHQHASGAKKGGLKIRPSAVPAVA
jgi:transposase